jgi:hypothetical protein
MNKIIKLAASYFWITCSFSNINEINPLEKILSQNYNVEFSIREFIYLNKDSVSETRRLNGIVTRSKNYICLKSDYGIGILEDSSFFYLDTIAKLIQYGPKVAETILLDPFHDPFEIFSYAKKYNSGFLKYYEGKMIIYDFLFIDKEIPVIKIKFRFDNESEDSSFRVEIDFHRMNAVLKDLIDYKFSNSSKLNDRPHISDFFVFRNGKDSILKKDFRNYPVYNSYYFLKK